MNLPGVEIISLIIYTQENDNHMSFFHGIIQNIFNCIYFNNFFLFFFFEFIYGTLNKNFRFQSMINVKKT